MKFFLSTILFLLAVSIQAQDSFLFQPTFKEQSTYKTDMSMDINVENFDGPEAMAGAMKSSMSSTMDMKMSTVTTDTDGDGKLPFTIVYDDMKMESAMMPNGIPGMADMLEDMKIYGKMTDGIKMEVDSISGADNPMMKNALSQGVQQMSQSIEFPTEPMAIGDTFEQDLSDSTPMSAQMPGMKMMMKYTLISVENGIASFQTDVEMSGEMGGVMKMNGTGSGISTYNLTDKYIDGTDLKMTMTMNMNQAGQAMSFDMVMDQKMNIELIK